MELDIDARFGKGFRSSSNQLRLVPDYITDVIWRGSRRKRDVLACLQYGYLQFGINSLSFGGSTGPSSTATNYDQSLRHG
jgi:hypothetical protein